MASQVPQAAQAPRAGSVRSKFIVNAILLAAFGLISAPHLTSIPAHEWLSVAFIGLIFVHLILSWNWITGVVRRFLSRLRGTTRFNFVWDVLLYLTMTVAMVSGFLVSEAALPALGFAKSQDRFWHLAHVWSAQAILVVVGVHLAMHFEWVMAAVKRLATRGETSPSTPRASGAWWIGPTAVIAVAAVIATAGTMLLGQTSLAERLRTPPARAAAARRTQADAPPPAATPPAAGGRANAADRPGRAARPNASGRASLRTRAKRTLVGIGKFFGIPFVATLGVLLLVRLARRGPAPSEREVLEEQVG